MEQLTHFRSAFNGFNREDVVRYLEFIKNKHAAKMAQLNNELDALRARQEAEKTDRQEVLQKRVDTLTEENRTLRQRIAELEDAGKQAEAPRDVSANVQELEAYRRAERVERLARERAKQIGDQTGSALADVGARVDDAAQRISDISGQIMEQLNRLQSAMDDSREAFEDAARVVADLHSQDE